ncbi:GNAT family N-acetyltransferase [Angustibacter sp. Root456]|uniref:GNAT family N-acetyltransferase n=1 Tax=Angustibacter sp. Root456 TaxID=1736539 RepID=UPI0009EBE1FE|nr:GNAT family N-acetyltransferase [Angustibacter sp. Root456]
MLLLTTPRTELRHWCDDDLTAYLDLYSRWDVMRWLGPQPRRVVENEAEARRRLQRWVQLADELEAPFGLWALVPRDDGADGTPVGTLILLPLDDADGATSEVEIGWHLHPDHQGRGLVTEAAHALLQRAADAGHRRVLAVTDDDNVASQAVTRRLAMVDQGLTDRWFGLTMRQFAWQPDPGA